MALKLIMTWDIREGKEQEYFEFVVRTFLPRATAMGLELSDAWLTIYGPHPQILVSADIEDPVKAQNVINSEEWLLLNDKLLDYVDNYNIKLVPRGGAFQF